MKNCFFIFCFLPLFSFGDFVPDSFLVRRWSSLGVEAGTLNSQDAPLFSVSNEDDILSVLTSSKFGFSVNWTRRLYDFGVVVPPRTTNLVYGSSYNNFSITNNLRGKLDGSTVFASACRYDRVFSFYQSLASLLVSGYTGPGFEIFWDDSSYCHCVNVDYPILVADVLSSTNSVFRQILFSHLSSIQSSVQNIHIDTSSLSSSVSSVLDVNSSILDNSAVSSSALLDISTNVLPSISSNSLALSVSISDLSSLFKASNPLSACSISNLISAAYDSSLINYPKFVQWQSKLAEFSHPYYDDDPVQRQLFYNEVVSSLSSIGSSYGLIQGFYNSILRDPAISRDALIQLGSYLSQDVVDALIGDYGSPTRDSKAVNSRTSIKSEMRDWREEAKRQLQEWQQDLKDDLQAWKTSDETGYLNVRSRLDNVLTNQYRYFDKDSEYSSINYGVHNLTNAADRISRDSSLAITNSINDLRDFLNDNLFGSEAKDLGVRITFPLRYESGKEVNVHDSEVADAIRNGYININELKSAILEALNTSDPSVRINGRLDLSEWIEEWRKWVGQATWEGFVTNSAAFYDSYRNFFDHGYDSLLAEDNVELPSGASSIGSYWYISSYSHGRANSFFTFVKSSYDEITNRLGASSFFRDPSTGELFSLVEVGRNVIYNLPTKSAINDHIDRVTNSFVAVEYASDDLLESVGTVTNVASAMFDSINISSSLPSTLPVWNYDGHVFEIPVSERSDIWNALRSAMAFGIVLVNLVLFPKFVLGVVKLFLRLFNKSLSYLPDRQ